MSATPVTANARKAILSSLKRYKKGLKGKDTELFVLFVDQTIGCLRGPFLARHTPKEILGTLQRAFDFLKERHSDEVKVEIVPNATKGITVLSCMNDQPFIVDTTRLFLQNQHADYWGGFNLTVDVERGEAGNLISIGSGGNTESLMFFEADAGKISKDIPAATKTLTENLILAHAVVSNFEQMTGLILSAADTMDDAATNDADRWAETSAFLRWLANDNFVFMGMTHQDNDYGIQTIDGPFKNSEDGEWPEANNPHAVLVRKTTIESPVHRAGRIDEILVSLPAGHSIFMRGMFTYRAVTQPSRQVPILRQLLSDILVNTEAQPGSYRYKGMANVFDSLPTEFLFTATIEATTEMVDLVFEAEQQKEVGVTYIRTGSNSAFCLIAMPKRQYSDEMRQKLEGRIVSGVKATYSDHGIFVGRYDTVLLHYYLTGMKVVDDTSITAVMADIRNQATPWLSRLWHVLANRYDERTADRLADTYGNAFPDEWVRGTTVEDAITDIEQLEKLSGKVKLNARLWNDNQSVWLRLYQAEDINISDIMPVFHNLGIIAISSNADEIHSRGGSLFLDTFLLDNATAKAALENPEEMISALEAVFGGHVTDDTLNHLVLSAGLNWREVDVIRGYARYCRQLKIPVSATRTREILLEYPKLVALLVDLFVAKFNPDLKADRTKTTATSNRKINKAMRSLRTNDEDAVFSIITNLINSTTRTNAYRTDRKSHYFSFKVECSSIPEMGQRPPFREIFVSSKDIEGLHIRFGMVARGGLRWSDRDDYRTEILGLATTQVVKNVVIVPTGSKGGFLLKHPSPDLARRRQNADTFYKVFIRGLLDLTDNRIDGKIVHPPRVVCHDGDDSYLVVAADKGTAHLSDTANALSQEYGFWLDDAFASGGSNGYDHKAVGITARGGWVLVKRHFAELERDPYNEPFTVAGIGDMGGDVFGNGLIESKHARLLAAFNHRHIFLDPNPGKGCAKERMRLFKAGREGGWDNYKTALISKGGGIFNRTDKSIPLSAECQEMLGLDKEEPEANEVIRAILKMNVDLLWNGGIGTYIKASFETDADANDRSNDALRVNGDEVRAKIVGEGGNLGFTQAGRIEASCHNVLLNTDFIDNSGGVDMSDHEVNLKVLFGTAIKNGDITLNERNAVLEEMTNEVADLVLANNDHHGRQISRDMVRFKNNLNPVIRTIAFIEREMNVDRQDIGLPSVETLKQRLETGGGITRPELAVMSSYIKIYIYQALLSDNPKALHGYSELLTNYFPKRVQSQFPHLINGHMLANEIAVSVAINDIMADAGVSFFPIMLESTGRSVLQISKSYQKALFLASAHKVRSSLEELRASVWLNDLHRAWIKIDDGARRVASFWLSAQGHIPSDADLTAMPEAIDKVCELQSPEVIAANQGTLDLLLEADIPRDVSDQILRAQYLGTAIMVWSEARRVGAPIKDIAVVHLCAAKGSRLDEVLEALPKCPASGRWEPIGVHILENRYMRHLRRLVRAIIKEMGDDTSKGKMVCAKSTLIADIRSQVDAILDDNTDASIATLMVLEARIATAIARLE